MVDVPPCSKRKAYQAASSVRLHARNKPLRARRTIILVRRRENMAKTIIHKPPTHKLRTLDEMTKALTVVEQHKYTLHVNADDEHIYVLADVITELLATRQV